MPPSLTCNLRQAIADLDIRRFVGLDYEPPFGCFRLVQRVFEAAGVAIPDYDKGLSPSDLDSRAARFHRHLAEKTEPTEDPQPGDLVLIKRGSKAFHIGVVVGGGEMLHAYSSGTSTIESYDSPTWRNKIEGFYRYV
jgi:cell wall-associated NlpC family hydrolase